MEDKPEQASPQEAALQALILDPDLERLEDLLAEFNLFRVLDIARDELSHSAFLAWLLNPRQTHGLGDYFLRHFLKIAAGRARELGIGNLTPIDIDGWALDDVRVVAERKVGTSQGRIDILLVSESDEFVCIIENKIGTTEHSNQLERYLNAVEEEYGDLNPFPIFLTPDGIAPESVANKERYVPFDYERISTLIERTLEARRSTIGASVASFLEQYRRTLRRYVVSTTDNIDELAFRIYNKHRGAINLINRALASKDAQIGKVIEAQVERHTPDLQFDGYNKAMTVRRLYSQALDGTPELKVEKTWTKSGHILLFELKHSKTMELILWITHFGPEETRKRLFDLAWSSSAPFKKPKKFRTSWIPIYRRPILGEQDYIPLDPAVAIPKVEQALKNFCDTDYFPIVNAIRAEFGLEPVTP